MDQNSGFILDGVYNQNDFIAPVIAGLFKRGYRINVMKEGEASFEVHIKREHYRRIGAILEWNKMLGFNKAVDKIFRTQLFNHMDMNRKVERKIAKQSMIQFLSEMNITEADINYDSLYRDYMRKQKFTKTPTENIGSHLVGKEIKRII